MPKPRVDPDEAMKEFVKECAAEDDVTMPVEHISLTKLKQRALGVIPLSDLNTSEVMAYEIYIQGYKDRGDVEQMVIFNKVINRITEKPEEEWTEEENALMDKFNAMSDELIGIITRPSTEIVVDNEGFDE